jgi:hypothetical protein
VLVATELKTWSIKQISTKLNKSPCVGLFGASLSASCLYLVFSRWSKEISLKATKRTTPIVLKTKELTKLAEIKIFQILVKTVWGGTAKDPIHSGVFLLKKKYLFVHFYLITYLVLNLSRLIRHILNRSFFSRKVGETGAIWDRGNVGHRTFLHVPIVLKN